MRIPNGRWIALLAAVLGLVALGLGSLAIRDAREEFEDEARVHLAAVAELTAHGLTRFLDRRSREVDRQARGLADLVERGALRGEEPWRALLVRDVRAFQDHSDFREVLVLDAEGLPGVAAVASPDALGPETRELVAQARSAPGIVRGDLYRCATCGQVHLEFADAIRNTEDEVLGFLVARITAEDSLFPDLLRWPIPSETAEVLLIERQRDEVRFLSPLRHLPEVPPLSLSLPLGRFRRIGEPSGPGPEGPWQGIGYHEQRVLVHVHPLPGTPWILLAQMDRTEALAPWTPLRKAAEAITLLAIAVIIALGMWLHRLRRTGMLEAALEQERALRLALSESEAILQGIGDGVIATDPEGRILRINPVAADLTGWSPGEALGRPLGEVFRIRNEVTGAPAEDPVARVLATGRVVGLANHTELVARDGTARPIADSGAPVRDDRGDLRGVVLVFRDQSAQRAHDRVLQEISERFQRFFAGLTSGAAVAKVPPGSDDPRDARWVAVNPALARLLGRAPEEAAGRTALELIGDAWARWVDCPQKAVAGVVRQLEDDWPLDPGRRVLVTLVQTLPDECIVLVEDVTAIRQAEEERRRFEAVAAQQQRLEAVGTLAAGVAHEINNPIQAILNWAEVLAGRPGDEAAVRECASEILRESERIAGIVRDLLGLARPGNDAVSTVRADAIWEKVLGLVRTTLQRERIEVRVEAPPDLPAIQCRPSQVIQVLLNLLVNARDALADPSRDPDRPRQVLCRSETVTANGRPMLRFRVQDNGPGIPEEVQSHLFEPFFTTKGRERGTGLGLWHSRRIAEQQGGRLVFETTPGEGTAFLLDLPLEETHGEGASGR